MKLSMWTLMDELKDYNPEPEIRNGARCLQSARLFTENMRYSSSTLYLTPMVTDRVIASNKNDILTLHAEDLNDVLNDILDIFAEYYEWEQTFDAAIASGCSIKELLTLFSEKAGLFFIFGDATFFIRDLAGPESIYDAQPNLRMITAQKMLPLEVIREINIMPEIRQENVLPYPIHVKQLGTAYCRNLFFNGIHHGWLICVSHDGRLSKGMIDLLDMLGEVFSDWISRHNLSMDRSQKTGLFLKLLEGHPEQEEKIRERLMIFGWQDTDEKQVYVLQPVEFEEIPRISVMAQIEAIIPNSFCLEYRGDIVVIANLTFLEHEIFFPQLSTLLRHLKFTAGESPVFTDLSNLKLQYEAAKTAAGFAGQMPGQILRFQEAILPYSFSLLKKEAASDLRHPSLALLKEYDAAHNADFYRTLECFLKEERNYTNCAKLLHIHRSTLIYRIERITELCGIDFTNPDERFHLLFSYYLDKT